MVAEGSSLTDVFAALFAGCAIIAGSLLWNSFDSVQAGENAYDDSRSGLTYTPIVQAHADLNDSKS